MIQFFCNKKTILLSIEDLGFENYESNITQNKDATIFYSFLLIFHLEKMLNLELC